MSRRWRKHWANNSVDDRTWEWVTGTQGDGNEKCSINRSNRLRFTPKAEAWGLNDLAKVTFTMPTGEVIRRIVYDYDFLEGGQSWELYFGDATNGVSMIADADGSAANQSYTPGTPVQVMDIRYKSTAGQTPTSDGAYFGEVSNIMVFGGEAAGDEVDLTQIAQDIVANFTDLNSSTVKIKTITQTTYDDGTQTGIAPFVMDNFPTLADILTEMAGYGDDSQNAWACGLLHSENVASPDGKPILFVEQQPALTDYDYAVSYDEQNLVAPLAISENYDELFNWIVVSYTDANGWTQYISPDDDANLKDTTSITDYGQRDYVLSVGDADADMATSYGRRFLAKRKDPQWRVPQPITVIDSIRKKDGSLLPASQMRAGKRLKVENYLNDLSGTGLTLLITGTEYDDEAQTCAMAFGRLDDFFIAPFSHLPGIIAPPGTTPVGAPEPPGRRVGF